MSNHKFVCSTSEVLDSNWRNHGPSLLTVFLLRGQSESEPSRRVLINVTDETSWASMTSKPDSSLCHKTVNKKRTKPLGCKTEAVEVIEKFSAGFGSTLYEWKSTGYICYICKTLAYLTAVLYTVLFTSKDAQNIITRATQHRLDPYKTPAVCVWQSVLHYTYTALFTTKSNIVLSYKEPGHVTLNLYNILSCEQSEVLVGPTNSTHSLTMLQHDHSNKRATLLNTHWPWGTLLLVESWPISWCWEWILKENISWHKM